MIRELVPRRLRSLPVLRRFYWQAWEIERGRLRGEVLFWRLCMGELLRDIDTAVGLRDKVYADPLQHEAWDALVGEDGVLDNDLRSAMETMWEHLRKQPVWM